MGHKVVIYQEPYGDDGSSFIGLEIDGMEMEIPGHRDIELKGGPDLAEIRLSLYTSDVQIKTVAELRSDDVEEQPQSLAELTAKWREKGNA